MRRLLTILLLAACTATMAETKSDSARHTGYTVFTGPAWQIAMDEYERKWLRDKHAFVVGAELNYSALPSDSDAFARDYNYPTLSAGIKISLNNGVTMRRTADPAWGMAQMVDYDSHLGDIVTLYGAFSRPLLRKGRWQLDYLLRVGVGYNAWKYNKTDNIDNELIGSHLTIYFGAGITATCQLSDEWGLTAGLLYGHHSNGALYRPNKGENHVGPCLGLRYAPYDKAVRHRDEGCAPSPYFKKYWYGDIRLGVGADVYYGTYYSHVRELDETAGRTVSHSPWSIGISARHEVYYHNLSLDMALGVYLHRQMGYSAKQVEQPYYEHIGVFYTFPRLGKIKLGVSVQAHRTKADLTEVKVSVPILCN